MKTTPVKNLNALAIDVKPVNMDWTQGYGETWESYEASRCEKCGAVIVGTNGEAHNQLDSESDCDGYVPTNEGPMMSYYYPLPEYRGDVTEDARSLVDLPLCLIHLMERDEYALALTGGGMDLTWQICEAFMLLGLLPPFHFTDLPGYADRGASATDRWIISGCRRSAQIVKMRAGSALRRLRMQAKAAKA